MIASTAVPQTKAMFKIGNCAGFSGDRVDAPVAVVDTLITVGGPSAIFFEVLGERTIALAQLGKKNNPDGGFEPMLDRLLEPILAKCIRNDIKIIGNFGGANPRGAARCIGQTVERLGIGPVRLGVVEGDDIHQCADPNTLEIYDADATLEPYRDELIAANVYLDARPMVEALDNGADVVITGRTGDPSLALAPLIHYFGWKDDDWDRLAVGATAGHLLECGAQVTGGVFYDPGFKDIPDPANIGFPIAEVTENGSLVITKAANTGGLVNLQTVKEQLLYEVHNPANYITPDVTLDFSGVTLEEIGPNRVAVAGIKGKSRPDRYKAVFSFEGGWLGEGEFSLAGPNCLARARAAAKVLRQRLSERNLPISALRIDLIGISSVHDSDDGALWQAYDGPEPTDLRVRLAVASRDFDAADQASREVLAFLCCGPAGSCGARWNTTKRISTQSFLVPRDQVEPTVTTMDSREFLR